MNKYCQTNEEDILGFIFSEIGTTNKFCVEFGSGDGYSNSNTRHLLEAGWEGRMMDCMKHDDPFIHQEFITAENVLDVFTKYIIPIKFDLLSIDIDGNDIWVLGRILYRYTPRVIVAEFNPAIPVGINKTIKYDPFHVFKNNDYYGASMEAFKKLATFYGYTIITNNGLNLFMVKNPIGRILDCWGIGFHYGERHDHATANYGEWVEYK